MNQNLPHDHGYVDASVLANLPDPENFQIVAGVFKQLSDGNRIRIFWLLCHCEECVINIAALVEMSSPAVSHHLKQLRSGGLITSRREGKKFITKQQTTSRLNSCIGLLNSFPLAIAKVFLSL